MKNISRKKKIAILAAVASFLHREEEYYLMASIKKSYFRTFEHGNIWAASGRQNIMEMRNLVQMKVF